LLIANSRLSGVREDIGLVEAACGQALFYGRMPEISLSFSTSFMGFTIL